MIPQCVHFFWAGPRMSWMRYMTIASFRRCNPDWRIVLHTMEGNAGRASWPSGEQQDSESGPDYSGGLKDLGIETNRWQTPRPDIAPAHASDLFQWEQLGNGGGWYADMDILFVRPMPSIDADADAVFCLTDGFMAIGLVGASPGCRLFRAIGKKALATYSAASYQSTGTEAVYKAAALGPRWARLNLPGHKCLEQFRVDYPELAIVELPEATVYPFNYRQIGQIFSETHPLPPECVGIHWFGGDRLSQEWNDRLTAENCQEHRNTFTAYAAGSA